MVSETVSAKAYGVDYRIDIYIPASYDAGTDSFATIYALDGDATNGLPDTRFVNLKNILQRRGTKAILVGIGGSARRQEDYNFPGANGYHAFLAKELVPYLESKYRMDPKRRMLSGLSTSGNLAATAMFLEAPDQLVFSYFLSTEAASSLMLYVTKVITFREFGAMPLDIFIKGLLVGASLMAGTFIGKAMVLKMSNQAFQHLLDALLFCSGVSLLWAAFS